MKRQRGRGRKGGGGQQNNRALESNGPDVKVRGAASTIHEKYLQLARDAASSGDRVKAENYHQHAEHYFRIVRAQEENRRERDEQRQQNDQRQQNQGGGGQNNGGGQRGQDDGQHKSESQAKSDGAKDEASAKGGDGKDSGGDGRKGGRGKGGGKPDQAKTESKDNSGSDGDPLEMVTPEEDSELGEPAAEKKPRRARKKPAEKSEETAEDERATEDAA